MKKTYSAVLGFVLMFAVTALGASPAFAADEFLLNGAAITSEMNFVGESTSNDILVEDKNALVKTEILCSRYDVYSGWYPFRFLLEVLMLNMLPLLVNRTEGTPGMLPDCEDMKGMCSEVSVPTVGLPWETELVLSGSTYVLLILKNTEKNQVSKLTVLFWVSNPKTSVRVKWV